MLLKINPKQILLGGGLFFKLFDVIYFYNLVDKKRKLEYIELGSK